MPSTHTNCSRALGLDRLQRGEENFSTCRLRKKKWTVYRTKLSPESKRELSWGSYLVGWSLVVYGEQGRCTLTVGDPPLALPVNPLEVAHRFLGGFHASVAPQGSPERSPHPADAHVGRHMQLSLSLSLLASEGKAREPHPSMPSL